MRTFLYLAAFALLGCANTPNAIGIANQSDIIGKWDIVQFDNYRPNRISSDGSHNAYVAFGDTGTSFHLTCNFTGNFATVNALGYLQNRPPPKGFDNIVTTRGCGKVREKRDDLFFEMMNSSPLVETLDDGRLLLSNVGHTLYLERSHIGRSKNAIRNLDEITGRWNIAIINRRGRGWGGSTYAKQSLSISKNRIRYGNCEPYFGSPIISENGQIIVEVHEDDNASSCGNLTDAEEIILELLSLGSVAEPVGRSDILLSYDDLSVVITKKKNW